MRFSCVGHGRKKEEAISSLVAPLQPRRGRSRKPNRVGGLNAEVLLHEGAPLKKKRKKGAGSSSCICRRRKRHCYEKRLLIATPGRGKERSFGLLNSGGKIKPSRAGLNLLDAAVVWSGGKKEKRGGWRLHGYTDHHDASARKKRGPSAAGVASFLDAGAAARKKKKGKKEERRASRRIFLVNRGKRKGKDEE